MQLPSLHFALIVIASVFLPSASGFSQDPPHLPPAVPFSVPANLPPFVPSDNPAAKSLIANSLLQEELGAEAKTSGDMFLDDVIEIIRRQGSVLDGSVLDPALEESLPRTVRPLSELTGSESLDGDSVYHAAEQLLRTSRMLQRLAGRDRERDELVHAMRRQAAKLMIDAISSESRTMTPPVSVSP